VKGASALWDALALVLVSLLVGAAVATAWGPHGVNPVPLVRCVDL
jgi:hypothetical protein